MKKKWNDYILHQGVPYRSYTDVKRLIIGVNLSITDNGVLLVPIFL